MLDVGEEVERIIFHDLYFGGFVCVWLEFSGARVESCGREGEGDDVVRGEVGEYEVVDEVVENVVVGHILVGVGGGGLPMLR